VLGRLIGLLIGFTLHEWAHAYTAVRIGGYSALPDHSRLSFDPRVHIDPFDYNEKKQMADYDKRKRIEEIEKEREIRKVRRLTPGERKLKDPDMDPDTDTDTVRRIPKTVNEKLREKKRRQDVEQAGRQK
jgi:hypothetical protein